MTCALCAQRRFHQRYAPLQRTLRAPHIILLQNHFFRKAYFAKKTKRNIKKKLLLLQINPRHLKGFLVTCSEPQALGESAIFLPCCATNGVLSALLYSEKSSSNPAQENALTATEDLEIVCKLVFPLHENH